jgi:hypothetical protein
MALAFFTIRQGSGQKMDIFPAGPMLATAFVSASGRGLPGI